MLLFLYFYFIFLANRIIGQLVYSDELPVPPVGNARSTYTYPQPVLFPIQEDQARVLEDAVHYGMEKADRLYDNLEPKLYKRGVFLDYKDPGRYLAAVTALEPEGKLFAKAAHASIHATHQLTKKFSLTKHQIIFGLSQLNMSSSPVDFDCPSHFKKPTCSSTHHLYRTMDGSCNNLYHPTWGQANRPFSRFLPPDYNDGIFEIRTSSSGRPLASARKIRVAVHHDENRPSSWASLMLMQWGQFLDHDLTFTPISRGFNNSAIKCCVSSEHVHPECFPIKIPHNDPFYSKFNQTCMEFVRSSPVPGTLCSLGPRNQINQVTSFLDASTVYGSSVKQSNPIRKHKKGLLLVSSRGFRQPLLPHNMRKNDGCFESGNLFCFRAGDRRVNEQPALASMHTLWVREHNRVARILHSLNKHWDDEKLFQETRRIIISKMQHITFNEFLPAILGPNVLKLFGVELHKHGYSHDYSVNADPRIANVFGAAVFRFGHSLVQEKFQRCDKSFQPMFPDIQLNHELMRPDVLHNIGAIDRLLLGLVEQHSQKRDEYVTDQLTNHLFQQHERDYGLDLVALNIQRGRDHGLPSYVRWREFCGLRRPKNFADLVGLMDPKTVFRLEQVYETVEDIDLFPGGMAEKAVVEGIVGPTFACLIALTFQNLRIGDRFWYENGGQAYPFTKDQLSSLRKVTLARVMCDNLDDVEELQLEVMRVMDPYHNPRLSCIGNEIPHLDLTLWKEESRDSIPLQIPAKTPGQPPTFINDQIATFVWTKIPAQGSASWPKDKPRPATVQRIRSTKLQNYWEK